MERELTSALLEWKNRKDRMPLVLMGARQVGKTWLLKEFGQREYQSVAYVNCDDNPLSAQLFLTDYNIDRILLTVQAITGVKPEPETTLIIFDELQEAPRGLHCLKYFQEKAPEYHVAATGSLLGLSMRKGESFPVGKVDIMRLYPMNFMEFVRAIGGEQFISIMSNPRMEIIDILAPQLIDLLRQYYFVGGMPGVVSSFLASKDLKDVRRLQRAILDAYRRDISKHADKSESVRIGQVLDSFPSQIAKENGKFMYGLIRTGARAAEYEVAIQWLIDAGIIHKVSRVNEIGMPLKFYEDLSTFKLFMLDCGLLGCMTNASPVQMLIGDNPFIEFKGAFSEQYVMQQLVAMGIVPFYWSNRSSPAEIDFVVETEERVIPVEVKAERNVRSRSMRSYISLHPDKNLKGLRISMLPYKDQGWMENIPLYGIQHYFRNPSKTLSLA